MKIIAVCTQLKQLRKKNKIYEFHIFISHLLQPRVYNELTIDQLPAGLIAQFVRTTGAGTAKIHPHLFRHLSASSGIFSGSSDHLSIFRLLRSSLPFYGSQIIFHFPFPLCFSLVAFSFAFFSLKYFHTQELS